MCFGCRGKTGKEIPAWSEMALDRQQSHAGNLLIWRGREVLAGHSPAGHVG
jgi:hypothetical protein